MSMLSNGCRRHRLWVISVILLGLVWLPLVMRPLAADPQCEAIDRLLPISSLATHVVLAVPVEKYYEGDVWSVKTYVVMHPVHVLKEPGGTDSSAIIVRHRGGEVPEQNIVSTGSHDPEFAVGDTVLVFLSPIGNTPYCEVISQRYGQYNVVRGRFVRGVLQGRSVSQAESCLLNAIESRSPERLAEMTDLVCYGEIIAQDVVSDSTSQQSTYTTVRVERVLRGELESDEVVVQQPGDIGDQGKWGYDMPVLLPRKHYVLFLKSEGADGVYSIAGGYGGSYRVDNGNVRRHNWPLSQLSDRIMRER